MNFKNNPKDPIKNTNPWTYAEKVRFSDWAEDVGKNAMYEFTLKTGFREGEVLALPWFNLDLKNRKVTVTRSVSYDEKGNPVSHSKTESSYRTINLSPSLTKSFRSTRKNKCKSGNDSEMHTNMI